MMIIGPGSKEHMRSTNYSKASVDSWKDDLIDKLKRTLNGIEPVVKEITVYNNTKTAHVTVSVTNSHMHVSVTDPEEPYKPFQLKPAGHCLLCGGTEFLRRYRLLDPPVTVLMHRECVEKLQNPRESYGKEQNQKEEPAPGDHPENNPEGL